MSQKFSNPFSYPFHRAKELASWHIDFHGRIEHHNQNVQEEVKYLRIYKMCRWEWKWRWEIIFVKTEVESREWLTFPFLKSVKKAKKTEHFLVLYNSDARSQILIALQFSQMGVPTEEN